MQLQIFNQARQLPAVEIDFMHPACSITVMMDSEIKQLYVFQR